MGRCIYGRMCEWESVSVGECGNVYMWADVHIGESVSGKV